MKYFSVVYSAIFAPYAALSADFGVVYFGFTAAALGAVDVDVAAVDSVLLPRASVWATTAGAKIATVTTRMKSLRSVGDMVFSFIGRPSCVSCRTYRCF